MNRLMAAACRINPSFVLKHSSFSPSISTIWIKSLQNPSFSSPINEHQIRFHSSSTSHYMNQFYPRSNSSFKLSSGNSLQSNVVRLNENVFLVDSGIGTPRICLQDELIGAKNTQKIRFENRVGFLDTAAGEPHINKQLLERFFIDLIAGDSIAKQRATARFNDLVGRSTDVNVVASGEPLLVLPRRYRQKRVWMELNKIWRSNSQVKGFVVGRVRAGYSVAIAGFVAFLPFRPFIHGRRMWNDRFTIESINSRTGNLVVL